MKLFKRLLLFLLTFLIIIVLYLFFNLLNYESKQVTVDPVEQVPIDQAAVDRFSQALRIKTISPENLEDFDSADFRLFSTFLTGNYPLVHERLVTRKFNEFSYFFEWKGSQPDLKPVVLMAHLDVVPVIAGNLSDWQQPPFDGVVKDGMIWGRGAIDDKVGVIGILEAVEQLLKDGYQPKRTVFLAFGHDEERGGQYGAVAIARHLMDRGVEAEYVLDEGMSLTRGMVPDITKDVALIGIAEKGFISLEMTVKIEGGHSSIPNSETAIDVMSRAIVKLKDNLFPAKITRPVQSFIDYLGPEMPFVNKLVFANSSLLGSVILDIYQQSSTGSALVMTTTSPTIFHSGTKDNVIPQIARSTINFRILPGESAATVQEHVKAIINDDRIEVTPGEFVSEPSVVSSTDSYGYQKIHQTIAEVFPGTLVAPGLVVGATDSRHFNGLSEHIYRFLPILIHKENVNSFHGLNERIPVEEYENAIRFYIRLLKNSTGKE